MPTNPIEFIWPGILAAQAIHVATKLRIPDLLASGPKTIAELASSCGAHTSTLERLLRALATLEMFARAPDGRFCNTPLTEVLRTDHPQSRRDGALFLPAPFLRRPLGELYESVRSGEPAFQRIFGQPFFDYLAAHSADAANRGDYALIRTLGHQMAGTGGAYGFEPITEIGYALEESALAGDTARVRASIDHLDHYLKSVQVA